MVISSIDLTNFRNYHHCHLDLFSSKNLIIGNNGTGKTNILESIVLACNTKSFRTNDDEDLIMHGKDMARVDLIADGHRYRVVLSKSGKSLFIDGDIVRRASDYIGSINAILFKPDDLEMFTQGPRYRRKAIDLELGKIYKDHLDAALTYNKLLKDKNSLLKEDAIDNIYLSSLHERMIGPIATIIRYRAHLIDFLDKKMAGYYKRLSGQESSVKVIYKNSTTTDPQDIKAMFNTNLKRDMLYRYSVAGPHKEDVQFLYEGHDVASYASQGQKRLLMLSFKLTLLEYVMTVKKQRPILLLDDILSELDLENKARLIKLLPKDVQTIITATDVEGIDLKDDYRLFRLEKRRNTDD